MFIGLAVRLLPNWEHLVLACPRCIFVMVSIFWSISPNLPGNGRQIMANLVWPETNPGYYPHDVQTSKVLKHTGKLGHSLKTFFYIYLHMSCIGVHTLQSSKIIYHFCAQQFWQLSCLFLVHGLYRLSFVHGFSDLWFNAKTTCPNHWSVAETQTDVAEHLSPFLVIWCLKWGIHGLYAR